MRHSTLAAPALTALTLLLAACGGGGGDSSPTTPPPPQNNAPSASLTADVTTGTAPLAVAFDGSGSSDSDGQIANYSWDFGDGNSTTTTTATTSHSYANAGNFTARLTVTDDDGATGAATLAISVDPSATNLTLSGRIQILTSSAVDSDVNDILSVENVSNNSFATAQPLPVPVTLGGYLNQPGTGPSIGRMFATGDTSDVYALSFAGGETIALNIGDAGANFDLRLFDDAQVMIDGSSGSGRSESVEVPDVAGDYFVEVINVSGASTYVLTVGSSLVASAERAPTRLTDPFVPGEILMR
ncbi:MAG: PKD domain-containing protein [Pseudomonadota bacterium]